MKTFYCLTVFVSVSLSVMGQTYFPSWFRTPRTEPHREVKISRIIDVTKFGAKPDDGKDDHEAIRKAFSVLSASGGRAKIWFPKGVYNIDPKVDKATHCFSVSGCVNFAIESDGADMIISDPTKGLLRVDKCSNGVIKGLRVDYSELPFSQGIIKSVDKSKNSFRFELDNGFPSPLAPHIFNASVRWGSLLEMCEDGVVRLKRNANNLVPVRDGITAVDGKIFEIKTSPVIAAQAAEGDLFVLIGRYNGRPTFSFSSCERITLLGNIVYAGPAGAFGIRDCSSMGIIECKVLRKEGRYISQNADCIHTMPARIGPWIEGCVFEGQMDDAINIKTELIKITKVISDDTFQIIGAPKKGDLLTLFNPREGVMMGQATVESVERFEGNKVVVSLDKAMPQITLKGEKDSDMFFNDNQSNESFVIKNNIFRDSRRYGMLIQGTHGTIEGNTLSGLSTRAITLQNGASWPEGFVPYNVHILSNNISNCGFDSAYWGEGEHVSPILIATTTVEKGIKAAWRGATKIVVSGNTINSNSAHAIMLSGADKCLIDKNVTTQKTTQPVYLENCGKITIK